MICSIYLRYLLGPPVIPVHIVHDALESRLLLTGGLVLQLHVLDDVGLLPRPVVVVDTPLPKDRSKPCRILLFSLYYIPIHDTKQIERG